MLEEKIENKSRQSSEWKNKTGAEQTILSGLSEVHCLPRASKGNAGGQNIKQTLCLVPRWHLGTTEPFPLLWRSKQGYVNHVDAKKALKSVEERCQLRTLHSKSSWNCDIQTLLQGALSSRWGYRILRSSSMEIMSESQTGHNSAGATWSDTNQWPDSHSEAIMLCNDHNDSKLMHHAQEEEIRNSVSFLIVNFTEAYFAYHKSHNLMSFCQH